ncbi:TonB-dependent receptor [Pseudoduganella albidiflava]|uniref:TonB-dependent receptor n=1 Tax=Pseudoduganella albidiflava TaxID=321983 RepID=A0A411WSD6_9BURK|nr:TonB-dependent receptor [Pseudoduganella albidiflava]QBH99695.1 TonB-dependent receptor [Pseudoduganella albidiflava]GGY46918.1 hypothetical protein GCM10007387_31420 [Pseudoduganella albidiflava]
MHSFTNKPIRLSTLSAAVSLALASMAASAPALAQQGATGAAAEPIQKVQVVATRASQQSGIERKKNAATAMDSIVAEDVGAFPDRNVAEAISRIAGIAVERGDFGEGTSVAVRGNSPDVTRVEIDGQGVQAGGGTDLNGGGSGRGVELREISADLIKSVDIVKGATADMTEGSLGGGVIIKTRTGLDFKKPFYSLRLAGSQNSLNKDWTPDGNLVLANQFLNGRLGVVFNGSASQLRNEGHSAQVTSNNAGYARAIDFDNSPEKTFAFNPSTVDLDNASATQPFLQSQLAAGSGFFNAATPLELIQRSAAAQSKADCHAAFPNLTPAEVNSIKEGNTRTGAINQRGNELLTCLNQWNDYTPLQLRYVQKRQIDKRRSFDLRLDFKLTDELTVFGKGSYQRRRVDDNFLTYGLGGMSVNPTSTASPTYSGAAYTEDKAAGTLVPVAGSGYYSYATPTWRRENFPWTNAVVNVDPRSVTVDANHHVTGFTIADGNMSTDQIHNIMETSSRYLQLGGTFRRGGLLAEFMAGDARSDFTKGDKRTTFTYNYGPATLSVLPNGLWSYAFPQGNPSAATPAQYATVRPAAAPLTEVKAAGNVFNGVPAYTIDQQPLQSQAPQITFTPKISDTSERTAKLDLTYSLPSEVPFLTRLKTGFNFRDTSGNSWGAGGYEAQSAVGDYGKPGYQRAILVPSANVRSTFVACQDTPGSLGAGGKPCQYGFVPSNSYGAATIQSGQTVLTPAQFQDVIAQSMQKATTQFFAGAKDRPAELINGWTEIDVEKVFGMVGSPNVNYNCVKECVGTDGKVYQQPVSKFRERTKSGYIMTDFALDHVPFSERPLPFGMELDGNAGVRVVNTRVEGTGNMTFTSIVPTANFDPQNPNVAGGTATTSITRATTMEASDTDYLPIWNLALWVVPNQWVVRWHQSKSVARPGVSSLLPSGTCTFDATRALVSGSDDSDMRCSGTVGNPALRPQSNRNQNLSVEWYPNIDSMFSVTAFRQKGKVGPAQVTGVSGMKVFQGSNLVDPQTGTALDDVDFSYNTWENGAATTRKGYEFSSKTAFTFLPWHFRYFGLDLNYTKLRSATSAVNVVDLITGDPLPPARESKYSYNWSLWYDDGKLSARVAVQAVAEYFTCIAACGANSVNNYPSAGGGSRIGVQPYNPGSPNFRDANRFIDAKIAYRINDSIEIFAEGRNLGKETTSNSQGKYAAFADGTPSINDYSYPGRRLMVGINLRN